MTTGYFPCSCGQHACNIKPDRTDLFGWDLEGDNKTVRTVHRLEDCGPPAQAELDRIATGDPNHRNQ